jgi:hypothetical protein
LQTKTFKHTMHFTTITRCLVTFALIGTSLANPLFKREDCQCAVCDVGPGDCQGDDLKDYNACVAYVLGECGRSCGSLAAGTGAQDGCYAAEITRSKPCENACVQAQLQKALCADDPSSQGC